MFRHYLVYVEDGEHVLQHGGHQLDMLVASAEVVEDQ